MVAAARALPLRSTVRNGSIAATLLFGVAVSGAAVSGPAAAPAGAQSDDG